VTQTNKPQDSRRRVFSAIRDASGGATAEAVAVILDLPNKAVQRIVRGLVNSTALYNSGQVQGASHIVWLARKSIDPDHLPEPVQRKVSRRRRKKVQIDPALNECLECIRVIATQKPFFNSEDVRLEYEAQSGRPPKGSRVVEQALLQAQHQQNPPCEKDLALPHVLTRRHMSVNYRSLIFNSQGNEGHVQERAAVLQSQIDMHHDRITTLQAELDRLRPLLPC
jgi:hypothetical protein